MFITEQPQGQPFPDDPVDGAAVVRKVAWRLMWFVMALYFLAILDRGNISFAALSMNKALGLNASMFGIAVGIMYFTYSLFEIPSNLLLARFGARATLTRIAVLWGIATGLMAFTSGPLTLYLFRGLLGFAESGLFPGVMLMLSLWFPFAYRARYNAMFNYAVPISYVCASLVSGMILELNGVLGIAGWKWLFLIEGMPPILLGIIGVFYLTDRPGDAKWLAPAEKRWLTRQLAREADTMGTIHGEGILRTLAQPMVIVFGLCNFGLFCGLASLLPWLPTMMRSYGMSVSQIGLVTAIPPLVGLVGMTLLSWHSDRIGERFFYAAATFFFAALGFVVAGTATDVVWVIGGFAIASVGIYGTQAIFWTIPQSFLSRSAAPGAIGAVGMLGSIGGATIPIAVGRIRDGTGSYAGGFYLVAAVLVAGGLLTLASRPFLMRSNTAVDQGVRPIPAAPKLS